MRGGFARGGVQPLRAGDHCAERGGGVVLVPPGTFRVAELAVRPGVALTGAGVERTTFRACGAAAGSAMFPSFLRPQAQASKLPSYYFHRTFRSFTFSNVCFVPEVFRSGGYVLYEGGWYMLT